MPGHSLQQQTSINMKYKKKLRRLKNRVKELVYVSRQKSGSFQQITKISLFL